MARAYKGYGDWSCWIPHFCTLKMALYIQWTRYPEVRPFIALGPLGTVARVDQSR